MSYIVKTRKGYYEERESYRDPVTGKPRSRFLRYLGKIATFGFEPIATDPQERMAQLLDIAERKAAEIDAAQREKIGETNAERQERLANKARFSQARFLEETTDPSPQDASYPLAMQSTPSDDGHSHSQSQPSGGVGSDDGAGS